MLEIQRGRMLERDGVRSGKESNRGWREKERTW